MALSLSEAELNQLSGQLFLFQNPSPLRLSKPVASGADLATRMGSVAAQSRFKDISFAVVDFTTDLMAPDIWLHKEEVPWQMASTGKLALLLAALQLRDDVRRVDGTGLVSTAADYDELFATIWRRSSHTWVKEASTTGAPRISTIFDLSVAPIDFAGAATPHDRTKLSAPELHEKWPKVPDLTFWERLWQTGAQSDNVAACTLGSEIGTAYVEAVQRAYGLFDPPGMHMLLTDAYGTPRKKTPVTRAPGAPNYRPSRRGKNHPVTNPLDRTRSKRSTQGGSVAALTAYMIALMQDKLVSPVATTALFACDVIRACLADETSQTATSLIRQGVGSGASVTKAHTKLGILGKLRCEFAYIEASSKKYGVVAMGILPARVGSTRFDEADQGYALGKAIHQALIGP